VRIVRRTRRAYSPVHAAPQRATVPPPGTFMGVAILPPSETTVTAGLRRATCARAIACHAVGVADLEAVADVADAAPRVTEVVGEEACDALHRGVARGQHRRYRRRAALRTPTATDARTR